MIKRIQTLVVLACFACNLGLPSVSFAQSASKTFLDLPVPGTMISTTAGHTPPLIQGIVVDAVNPLKMDFIVDTGDAKLRGDALTEESMKLVKYFLSTLTIPEQELWVNLSPYEKDRIISKEFSKTEMGRDLLAEDYILKQLSASLTYPEKSLGNKFWQRVYSQAKLKFGSTEIPMNTFNKIWIVPDKAVVLEHENGAYVIDSHLKVMLEEDYLALKKNLNNASFGLNKVQDKAKMISGVSSQVVREILVPEIEKEVNEGQNFANLRQIYNSMILATWYKKNLRETLLGKVYVDQSKTKGIDNNNPAVNQEIYDQYLRAFKKGVYNYIKEDQDAQTQTVIPRKYFSGGFDSAMLTEKLVQVHVDNLSQLTPTQLAGVQKIVKVSPDKFRVTIALLENTTAGDAQKATGISPKATVIAQRVTTQRGAKTGEMYIDDAIDQGSDGIIAGHSESRKNFGDGNQTVNEQIKAAHARGLKTIILAVGETGSERSSRQSNNVIAEQVGQGLLGLTPEQVENTVIAYEPRWAIQGPDFIREADPTDAQEMAAFIRAYIAEKYSPETAGKVRIIYGGSVNKGNALKYLALKDIDGALPGGASASVDDFKAIIEVLAEIGPKEGRTPFVAGNQKTYALKNSAGEFAEALNTVDPSRVEIAIAPAFSQIKIFATAIAAKTLANARKSIPDQRPQVHFGFEVPQGQPKNFFTNIYNIYSLVQLFKGKVSIIPDEVVQAIKDKLNEGIKAGKIRSVRVNDYGADSIDIHLTHNFGELNASEKQLMLEAMRAGLVKAGEMGLLKDGIDPSKMSLQDLMTGLNEASAEHSITERDAESVVVARFVGATPGAANIKLFHEFAMPGSTPLQKLGLTSAPGFRFRVRRTQDILKGNTTGPEWEFEISAERTTKDGVKFESKNESIQLLALLSQPNDYQVTGVYPVEGGKLSPNEPIATVVYQMSNQGEARITNTAIIYRSQSGADAVGGIASIVYDANMVPGGENGEHFVATKPVTQQEARRSPQEGIASVSLVAYQSRRGGEIPSEAIVDHVGVNPPAVTAQETAAENLAKVFITHPNDQPYLAPWAAEAKMERIRSQQDPYFLTAPRDNELDPVMADVEQRIQEGKLIVVTHEKADMGGTAGHTQVPAFMEASYNASLREAAEQDKLFSGNTVNIGDDGHMLMIGDRSGHGEEGHQLAFLAFTRAYLLSSANRIQPYGEGQDYQGPEAKAAKKNPYFYSRFSERFFELLREEMAKAYPDRQDFAKGMVDTVYAGWKQWEESGKSSTQLSEPFSGNVSQQGIGYARYMVDIEHGETVFDVIAGDKMGPPALNRLIRETVFNAVDAGAFPNSLVFEIWDAKAFDHNGNIPVRDIPEDFKDVKNLGMANAIKEDQEFLTAAYSDGKLRSDLSDADRQRLIKVLKVVGFIPTKRIFLDAIADREAIIQYLADSDRFNIKHVWGKKEAGWDISNPQQYLDRLVLASSITRLGILTGGEYVGKDDPVMVGNAELLKYAHAFLAKEPIIIQGDMNGSHWLWAVPTAKSNAVATTDSHPFLVALQNTLSSDGKRLIKTQDIFEDPQYDATRKRAFDFNWSFKKAQLGGQWEPLGTNVRTVEASYELAKILRDLNRPGSHFLVSSRKAIGEVRAWPVVAADNVAALNQAVVTGQVDQAAIASPGGIDLNSKFLDLQIKRDRQGTPLPMPQQSIQNIKIDGFFPVIINVVPVTNTLPLLGVADQEPSLALSDPSKVF